MPEVFPAGLTKRQRAVVSVVRSRQQSEGAPCYVLPGTSGHTSLYVPVRYSRTADGPLYERLWSLRNETLQGAVQSGCVALGPPEATTALRGLPPGRVTARLIPDWDWAEQRGAPLRVSSSCCGNMHSRRCHDCPMETSRA